MRFVERAVMAPHRCIVYPQLGSDHPKGYIDPGKDLVGVDPRPYLSVQALEDEAAKRGWVSPDDHAEQLADRDEQIHELGKRLELAEQELADANREIDSVYVLRSKGWSPAKKPGRPKKTTEEAA